MQKSYAIELLSSPIFSRLHYGRWLRWKKEFIRRLLKTRRYESFSFQSLIRKKSSFKRRLVDNILWWRSFWGHIRHTALFERKYPLSGCDNLWIEQWLRSVSVSYHIFSVLASKSMLHKVTWSNKLVRKRPNIIKIDYQSLAIRLPCRTDRITPSFSFSMSESEASWPWKVVILIRGFSLEESV